MKLITFDTSNIIDQKRGDATIHFTTGGAATLSKTAVENMNLQAGEMLAFHQDEENPEDWYISLSEDGFLLRQDKNETSRLKFNSSILCKMILSNLEIDSKGVAFFIGSEPTIDEDEVAYWPIITKKPIIRSRKK